MSGLAPFRVVVIETTGKFDVRIAVHADPVEADDAEQHQHRAQHPRQRGA